MPSTWRKSLVAPLYKGKGEAKVCGNYRTMKLMEHALKVVERVFEGRSRKIVWIEEEQYGFMPGRGTTYACFILRQMQEEYLEMDRELYMVFVDLEKAFDRVLRKVIEYSLRKIGVTENTVQAVVERYEGADAVVTEEGVSSGAFKVKVGVHQDSLAAFLCD